MGAVGGGETVTLTTAQIPSHTHIQDAHVHIGGEHTHNNTLSGYGTASTSGNGPSAGNTPSATSTNQSSGSSTAHAVVPPALVINHIIKT